MKAHPWIDSTNTMNATRIDIHVKTSQIYKFKNQNEIITYDFLESTIYIYTLIFSNLLLIRNLNCNLYFVIKMKFIYL